MPRRVSGLIRSESVDLSLLRKVYVASHPPVEIQDELEKVVERVFTCTPKVIRDYCTKNDYRDVEVLLSRKTWKLIVLMKSVGVAREEGNVASCDELSVDEAEGRKCMQWPPCSKTRAPSVPVLRRAATFDDWINHPEFSEWLVEFLFILWYSCDRCTVEAGRPASLRQICKQIVFRARHSRNRNRRTGPPTWQCVLKYFPWRTRLFLGEEGPLGERSWAQLHYDPFERDRLRESAMAISSSHSAMHWLTREFEDPSVEKAFQVDFGTRRMRAPYWPFFLTLLLVSSEVFVRYGLIKSDYPSLTLVRLFITEPVSWLIVAAIIQLAGETVLFADSVNFQESFFFYQFIQAFVACAIAAIWMYEVRLIFVFVAWPINEGFTMAFTLVCVNCLYYVRFIYLLWLIVLVGVFTVSMRYALTGPQDEFIAASFPLQQTIFVIGALGISLSGRYLFETHSRIDFILCRTLFFESERSDRLLRNILPEQVIQHLKDNDDNQHRHQFIQHQRRESRASSRVRASAASVPLGIAEAHDKVTILFADVCNFTTFSSHITPEELVLFLNELFTCFDDIAEETGLEKIKTIGDAYLAISGIPDPNPNHVVAAARMGLRIASLMKTGQFRDHENKPLGIRIGIHSGSCVAGVIGRKKFIYDIWGDAVNTASRMESTGEVNMVHCSEDSARLLELQGKGTFELQSRGAIDVKGKGIMNTYFILGEKDNEDSPGIGPIEEETSLMGHQV